VYLGAVRAESFMSMKSLVGFTVALAQRFYLLHLAIVFLRAGKEFK
jgi:hypothetical protein